MVSEGIILTKKQLNYIVSKSKENAPVEVCGLLFGSNDGKIATIENIQLVNNVLNSSTDFKVDPQEFIIALTEAEKKDLELIGFFHSHPAPSEPSVTDVRVMRLWPDTIWLIISSITYELAAYQIVEKNICRVPLKITK